MSRILHVDKVAIIRGSRTLQVSHSLDSEVWVHVLLFHLALFVVSSIEEYFMDGDSDFARPAQELFIWAVLMNRQEMAKLFWREGNVSHEK